MVLTYFAFFVLFSFSFAQRGCESGRTQCPTSPPYDPVNITADSTYRYITTAGCPPYSNPHWTNPATACTSIEQKFTFPLVPKIAPTPIPAGEPYARYDGILYLKEDPSPIMGPLGVLTSGVKVFGVGSPCGYSSKCPSEGAPTKYVDAVESEGHTVDQCGGHAAPTNDYHIHSSIGINTTEGQTKCVVPTDTPGQHSPLIGWIFDGYGLYGQYSEGGVRPTNLDSCGGHTHEINGTDVYHYHIPNSYPWSIGCFKGCPLVGNNRREFPALLAKYGCQ